MLTAMREISNSDDMIDVRDVIARFEELESERENAAGDVEGDDRAEADALAAFDESEEGGEYELLGILLNDLKGYGGDEQWRGDWYPIMLIRDTYFRDYAQELAEDIGAINADATWPNNCIDWDQATRELQQDYSTVTFDGVTYWYR